ncbi:MAG: YitT family protein [Verrucomicrobiales bacterium]
MDRNVKNKGHRGLEYLLVLLAGLLYAFSLKYFVLPSKVVLTGTEGIAAALSYYFESPLLFIGLYFLFQAILLAFAFVAVGRVFALRSALVVTTVVLMLLVLPDMQFADPEPQNERIILVIFGGLLSGVAKALAFRNRGSTGDEDILGAYFAMKYLKPVGHIAVIAAIGSTAFGLLMNFLKNGEFVAVVNTLMYTCIYIFVSAESLNNFYRKFKITILAIVTKNRAAVGGALLEVAPHRTFTHQEVKGGHSGQEFTLVKTIVTYEELAGMKEAAKLADPDCFYYHQDLSGVSRGYYIEPIS